jgi:hypothetical protein
MQILPENVKILTWICWGQNFEKFRPPPPPLQYIENFQSPRLMPENILVPPPLTSSSPPLGIINVLSLTHEKLKRFCLKFDNVFKIP